MLCNIPNKNINKIKKELNNIGYNNLVILMRYLDTHYLSRSTLWTSHDKAERILPDVLKN